MAKSTGVVAEAQIPEFVQPDPSHERDQKQKGGE